MRKIVSWFSIVVILASSLGSIPVSALEETVAPNQTQSDAPTPMPEGAPGANSPISPIAPDVPVSPPAVPIVTQSVPPSPTLPETTPSLVVVTFNVSSTLEYTELYNQSSQPVDLSAMTFTSSTSSGEICRQTTTQKGWVLPGDFITIASPSAGSSSPYRFSSDCLLGSDISRLEVYQQDVRTQLIDGITAGAGWFRHASNVKSNTKTVLDCSHKTTPTIMKQTGNIADYVHCMGAPDLAAGSMYMPPLNSGLKIIEILPNARSCLPSDIAPDCSDYIKVKNASPAAVNLAEFRIRTGSKNMNATISTSFNWEQPTLHPDRDEYMLEPGKYSTVRLRNDGQPLSLSNSDGNVWIEDYFGVKSYDETAYSGMSLVAAAGKSWAYDEVDSTWKLGVPSPGGKNIFPDPEPGKGSVDLPTLKPCRDDQYRSEETNRCRNVVADKGPTPCKEGQYRSEETNRCRSIASAAAAVLKPCADDQFRNPLTGRCKKTASSDDVALADCGEGRERNPETNRCRNIRSASVPDAAFAVQPIKDAGTAFAGWWALGGIGVVALGYAGWEWREEVLRGIRKVRELFISGK